MFRWIVLLYVQADLNVMPLGWFHSSWALNIHLFILYFMDKMWGNEPLHRLAAYLKSKNNVSESKAVDPPVLICHQLCPRCVWPECVMSCKPGFVWTPSRPALALYVNIRLEMISRPDFFPPFFHGIYFFTLCAHLEGRDSNILISIMTWSWALQCVIMFHVVWQRKTLKLLI